MVFSQNFIKVKPKLHKNLNVAETSSFCYFLNYVVFQSEHQEPILVLNNSFFITDCSELFRMMNAKFCGTIFYKKFFFIIACITIVFLFIILHQMFLQQL